MWKEKIRSIRDYIIKHSKIAFPIIVIGAVAATVTIALNAKNVEDKIPESTSTESTGSQEVAFNRAIEEVPLVENTDPNIYTLVATYYNAKATGDVDTIKNICSSVDEIEEIRILEFSKYIESYPSIKIYVKPGLEPNTYMAYAHSYLTFYGYPDQVPGFQAFYIVIDENGNYYFNTGEISDDILQYIQTVNEQDDVVELINNINVEYYELLLQSKELAIYMDEVTSEVSRRTGELLAAQVTETEGSENPVSTDNPEAGTVPTEGETPSEEQTPPVQTGPIYAKATTTVNLRQSDSEQAEKIGKVPGSTKLEVIEQLANGWSKVKFEDKEGFIKSEYLQVDNAVQGGEFIGTVTATSNVNIRSEASESASKIGFVVGGDTVDLISRDNGWCKISYNGLVGFVKEDYVQ